MPVANDPLRGDAPARAPRTAWLSRLEDPRVVGAFRIGLGLCILGDLCTLLPHLAYFYGIDGVASACIFPRSITPLCRLPGEAWATALIGLGCVAALAFTLGVATRLSKWACAILFASVVLRNAMPNAGQHVLGNFLFLLCLSRCGAAYSIDNWRRVRQLRAAGKLDDGSPENATYRQIPAWPRWLMILQLTIAYTAAGWAKTGVSYVDGSSFYYLISNNRYHRFPPWWLLSHLGDNLLVLATWTAWWFERLFPLAALGLLLRSRYSTLPVWIRWPTSRWLWASLALCFTGTLVLCTNLGWFVPATAIATLGLFRGEEVGRVVDGLLRRRSPSIPTSPTRAPTTTPLSPAPKARAKPSILLSIFVAWHTGTMLLNTVGKEKLEGLGLGPVHSVTSTYGALTTTYQFWKMFSTGVSNAQLWTTIDVVDASGSRHPAVDDRQIIGARGYPYIFLDRRRKAQANLLRKEGWRRQHARYLCKTWSGADGARAETIELGRIFWRLPSPEQASGQTAQEYADLLESTRVEDQIMRYSCSIGQIIAPDP